MSAGFCLLETVEIVMECQNWGIISGMVPGLACERPGPYSASRTAEAEREVPRSNLFHLLACICPAKPGSPPLSWVRIRI